jgi:hypothetical protein
MDALNRHVAEHGAVLKANKAKIGQFNPISLFHAGLRINAYLLIEGIDFGVSLGLAGDYSVQVGLRSRAVVYIVDSQAHPSVQVAYVTLYVVDSVLRLLESEDLAEFRIVVEWRA